MLGAVLRRGTVRGSSHRVTARARCGREVRGRAAPRLPSGTVQASPARAALRARCGVAAGHGAWKRAPGDDVGTVRTGGAGPGRDVPPVRHGAGFAGSGRVACLVRRCGGARCVEARTG
ncbi:hypothetical protein CURTO8I2_220116 [Curtobacterium sp. 8I-2]|nr:hypothetical protein CURTO8I2_220116 [Curtobacterium sp. 8I-2]